MALLLLATPVGTAWAGEPSNTEEHRALMISAQVMQKEGKLLRAHELLTSCSQKACAAAPEATECEEIRAFCGRKLDEVQGDIASVNLRVLDDRGLRIQAERVELDSVAVDPSKPLSLDPGPHQAKASYAGRFGEAEFVLARGQREVNVVLRVDLRETVQRRPIPAPVYVLGATTIATGVLALGTGIYTARAYQGLDSCQPYCDVSQRASLRATGYVADVSMLVALASAVAGAVWFFARPTVTEVQWLRATTTTEGSPR
jgi:hypothetical protein